MILKHQTGFTLIELLTGLLILGIMLGLAALSLSPNEEKLLQEEAQRLALLLQHAQDEALTTRHTLAWSGELQRYDFWKLNENREWQEMNASEPFRSRTLPENIVISHLSIDQTSVPARSRIIFNPSGVNPSYRITLTRQQQHYYVSNKGALVTFSADTP